MSLLGFMALVALIVGLVELAIWSFSEEGRQLTPGERRARVELEALRAMCRINAAYWQARQQMRAQARRLRSDGEGDGQP